MEELPKRQRSWCLFILAFLTLFRTMFVHSRRVNMFVKLKWFKELTFFFQDTEFCQLLWSSSTLLPHTKSALSSLFKITMVENAQDTLKHLIKIWGSFKGTWLCNFKKANVKEGVRQYLNPHSHYPCHSSCPDPAFTSRIYLFICFLGLPCK